MFLGRRQGGPPSPIEIVPLLRSLAELGGRVCYKHGALNGALTHAAGSRIAEVPVSKHVN